MIVFINANAGLNEASLSVREGYSVTNIPKGVLISKTNS